MAFYIDTIEQIKGSDGALTEYGKREKVKDLNTALSKFYTTLANVSADLGKNHTYMSIKIVNSYDGIVKSDNVGDYQLEPTS